MSAGDPLPAPAASAPGEPVNLLGVDYRHIPLGDAGDLYLTDDGLPWAEHLRPENWFEPEWFRGHRSRLKGTSTVYRVPTRPIGGRSRTLVVKWCRVGVDVPLDTFTLNRFAQAEFNSPYEEFALVRELRAASRSAGLVRTHRPLAIYTPAERLELWQMNRRASRLDRKKAKHRDVELDIFRQYILIYEWIGGQSIAEALQATNLPPDRHAGMIETMTRRAIDDLAGCGFRVLDMKPAHVIVRPRADGSLLREPDGRIAYALVDFELLERTPEHEVEVARARRTSYLRRQRDRFGAAVPPSEFPAHLRPASVLGVDYVVGHSESTHGTLWVVGRDPGLFDFFLPERWRRTKREQVSATNEVYRTCTKDAIHVVWKVSRVGEIPEGTPERPVPDEAAAFGYNSPFEEFAAAIRLAQRGAPAVYPRAIYMTGLGASGRPVYLEDPRRFERHAGWTTPWGTPVLPPDHLYITIWGYWNGSDERLALRDADYGESLNLAVAVDHGHLHSGAGADLLDVARRRLAAAGAEDLNLKPDHVLLIRDAHGLLVRDADGLPEMRHCNFETMRMEGLGPAPGPAR